MKIRPTPIALVCVLFIAGCARVDTVDLSGNWTISSSVGGQIAITVYCSLSQQGQSLSGTCTPEMENPQSSTLTGTTDGATASWGYAVVFNGNPGTVEFQATSLDRSIMAGTLILSGTPSPFTAVKQPR